MPIPSFRTDAPQRRELLRWSGWFIAGNWLVLLAVATRYGEAFSLPEQLHARIFLLCAYLGHFAFLATAALLPLVALVAVVPRRKPAHLLGVALAVALQLLIVTDTVVFAQYRFHINGMVVNLVFGGAAGEIFEFTGRMWWIVAALVAGLVALEWALAWVAEWWSRRLAGSWIGVALAALLAFSFLAENALYAWADARHDTAITRQVRYLPAFQPPTVNKLLARMGVIAAQGGAELVVPENKSGLHYPLSPMSCTRAEHPLNTLVLVVDSWRFDMLNDAVTPHINAFARKSWRFENHFSGGNESRTGLFTLFYGIPATYWHDMLQEQRGPVLISEMMAQGFDLGIYGSAPLSSPEFDRTVFVQVPHLQVRTPGDRQYERDRNITSEMVEFLDRAQATGRPFFGFLFYDSPHGRYDTPPDFPAPFRPYWKEINYLALDAHLDPTPYLNRYKNSINFVDGLVGQVLAELERTGLLERTIVVITADHGEEFNDNGLNYWGHTGNFTRYQTQVPLVVRWPGQLPRTFTHQTSHGDLPPTLLSDWLGCRNAPADYSTGRHLLDASQRDFLIIGAYNRFSVVDEVGITVYYFAGLVESYDHRYRERPGGGAADGNAVKALERIGRFYAR